MVRRGFLQLAGCIVGEEAVCVVALRDEDYRVIELYVARRRRASGRGETDSEMFNATSTLNICSRNDSLAILVEAVNHVARERDLDAHVFDRVLGFSRFPKIVFRILCHLEWGFYALVPYGVPISFLIGSRVPTPSIR